MKLQIPQDKEFFSIGEVSRIAGVPPYVVRYWESRFGQLRPSRRQSGQRKFTRRDIETIGHIRELLHERRYTIEGARKFLRTRVRRGPVQMALEISETPSANHVLREVQKDISDLLRSLKVRQYEKK